MNIQKNPQKYRYDIALQDGVGKHLVTWVTGLMVFFMTLMLAANIGFSAVVHNWMTGLSGSLTVEIKPPVSSDGGGIVTAAQQKDFNDTVKKVLWLSGQHPAVSSAHQLSQKEMLALIEPWLGKDMAEKLPLPALIDLKLAPQADVQKLENDILKLVPDATIDSHTDTLNDVRTLVNTAQGFIALLTCVIMFLAVVAISGIVDAKFSIHKSEAGILRLLGAQDEYIARQFRRHTLQGTLKGAAIGVTCMIVTLLAISYATHAVDASILPKLHPTALQWAVLILSPFVAGTIIAHITAQTTVMRALAKQP